MIDPDRQLELVPESVKLLLRPLLKSDIKVAFWGQNLIRCLRPRSGVVPLPLGFTLQLHHRFSSKWLLRVHAAAGHHNYAKATRLYIQMTKTYEKGSAEEIVMISSFKENGNHVKQ